MRNRTETSRSSVKRQRFLDRLLALSFSCTLGLGALLGCGCTEYAGYYQLAGQLSLREIGSVPRWNVVPGPDVILVVYSSRSGAKESGANEEVVLQLDPSALATGEHALQKVCRSAHYQRGGQVLSYDTTHVSGTLRVQELRDHELKGSLELNMTDPGLDLAGIKVLSRVIPIQIAERKP